MGARSKRPRKIAAVGTVTALLIVSVALGAAVGLPGAIEAPEVRAAASGSLSLTDSRQEGAIFDLANMGPGDSGVGEVTISNGGSAPGSLSLASTELSDALGRYGGRLSERLQLQLELLGSGAPATVYSGQLGAMPELDLGVLAPGRSRTYRFRIVMLDGGGPASPFVDDNVYQRATTGIGYQWTLIEVEDDGSGPEPPTAPSPQPAPSATAPPSPPVSDPLPIGAPGADRLVGGSEDDVIRGLGGADRIYGKGGRDLLFGGAGPDWVFGGAGLDRLIGGGGRDRLFGGADPDTILARGGGADVVDCGGGRDTARVDPRDRIRNCEKTNRPPP